MTKHGKMSKISAPQLVISSSSCAQRQVSGVTKTFVISDGDNLIIGAKSTKELLI